MNSYSNDDLIYFRGSRLTILMAETTDGDCPIKDFIDDTDPSDWAKIDRVLVRLANFGKVNNTEQFRDVDDGLFEVKETCRKKRIAGYFLPGHFIITHGFEKRGGGKAANKFPPRHRERALRIKEQFRPKFEQLVKRARYEEERLQG